MTEPVERSIRTPDRSPSLARTLPVADSHDEIAAPTTARFARDRCCAWIGHELHSGRGPLGLLAGQFDARAGDPPPLAMVASRATMLTPRPPASRCDGPSTLSACAGTSFLVVQ